jgi:tetratricopeptide (TPR) repeat protein
MHDPEGWSLAARRLLPKLRQPIALENDVAGLALRDAMETGTVFEAVRLSAERAVAHTDPRFSTIVARCDVGGETMKVVAADLHISLRHLFRYRAMIFEALGAEMRRVISANVAVPRDAAAAEARRLTALAEFLLARMAPSDDLRAIAAAERALRADPNAAGAWCAVAASNIALALRSAMDSTECCARAASAIDRAEEITPRSGAVLGLRAALSWVLHDNAGAERLAQEAIATPSGSARGHQTLAWVYAAQGEFDAAEYHSVAATLHAPAVASYKAFGMAIAHLRGNYARCAERCRELLEIDLFDSAYVLGYYTETLNALGRFEETIAVAGAAPSHARNFSVKAAVIRAHCLLDDVATARSLAREFRGPAVSSAAIALSFGDEDRAWRALERARSEPNGMMELIPHDPAFRPLLGQDRLRRLIAS